MTNHHPIHRRVHTAVLIALATVAVSACGSGDDADGPSSSSSPSASTIRATISTTAPATTAPATAPVTTAPATVASTAPATTSVVTTAPPLDAPLTITITDSAFDVPGSVRPGGAVEFVNVGNEAHYVQIRRIADGSRYADAAAAVDSFDAMAAITTEFGAPGNVITPGHRITVATPVLVAGDYILLDWFPVEGDTTGAFHAGVGLVASLTVEGDPVDPPTPTESYTITAGQAIDGPTELTAGHHEIEVRFTDGAIGFPTLFTLADGDDPQAVVDRLAAEFDQEPWAVGTGMHMAGYLVASLFGPVGGDVMTVGVDLAPGRYLLTSLGYDNDGAPVLGPEQVIVTVA